MKGTDLGRAVARPAGWRAIGWVILAVVILSSTPPAAKFAIQGASTPPAAGAAGRGLPVGLIPLIRFGGAGLILAPFVLGGGVMGRMVREDWRRLLLAGAFCVPINQWFFLTGAKFAPAGHIGLIYAACPLVVLALAALLGQERLAPERIIGVAASVVGVALVAMENLGRGGAAGRDALLGDLLEVAAVIAWGAYLTVNKPLVARHGALPVLAATFLVGAAFDLPLALASCPGWPPLSQASPTAWLGLAHMTLVVSVGGLAFQNLAMRSFDASQVATFGNVSPLLCVGWGFLLFDERIAPVAAVGGALVLAGILWAGRPPRKVAPAIEPGPIRRVEPAPAG